MIDRLLKLKQVNLGLRHAENGIFYPDPSCFLERDSAPAGSVAGLTGRDGKIIPAWRL